jgi:hypothetical protein
VHTVDLDNTHLFCCHVRIRPSNCFNFFFLKCISRIKGYSDSPTAIRITEIYQTKIGIFVFFFKSFPANSLHFGKFPRKLMSCWRPYCTVGCCTVTGSPAVDGVPTVASVPADPGVSILAGGFTYWIVE